MEGIARTWRLIKQSVLVLLGDEKLIVFPILSGVALLALDGAALRTYGAQLRGPSIPADLEPFVFLLYWLNYFVVLFFNSALMACVCARIEGRDGGVGTGLRTAWNNIERIFLWSFAAATVGFVLQLLEQSRGLRTLIASTLGLAWSLATFFVLPVLIFEDTDVFGAFQRSIALFRHQWGSEVTSNVGFGLLYFLLTLPACAAPFLFPVLGVLPAVVGALGYLALLFVVMTAVQSIFVVELYRFASGAGGGVEADDLQNVFS